ncbi:cell cycle checkpoint protein RAD17-like isoform X2 [Dendronephthya gigantea]|uniref:cell cycle checkpoint protein RAD17-like isoform X2 n=1 Tax=Dendronephthya gigantea TaxID=151771 RepID=UPI00106C2AB6|nr:cell cycle checkpoint protein RAD17-like isoform X2 [Dendronephthya gigantea]
MSQKRRDLDCSAEANLVEPSPEKKKKQCDGLRCNQDSNEKQVKSSHKKQQWLLSSFDCFDTSHTNGAKNLKKKSKVTDKSRVNTLNSSDLWCEKYCPSSEAELAVHKKKIAEVRDWLVSHLCLQSGNGVLLLTGPPGSGKTATMRVLAKEIGVQIQEWVNPSVQNREDDFEDSEWKNYQGMVHRQSQLKNFRDFFLRANKYPCLSLSSNNTDVDKKIVLVEDIPNGFYRKASDLHDILGSYKRCSRNPVVFIVSDSNSNDTSAFRLFPKDTIQDLSISQISFNPASVTSLNKLAKEIISSESNKRTATFQTPSKDIIDNLVSGCNGDIRGLINNLQFTCLKGFSSMTFQKMKHMKQQSRAGREKSGKRSNKKPVETENTTSATIGGKDTSLFLFRVLGKVLYCKRDESRSTAGTTLPSHLKHCERHPLIENPESIFEKSHMSGENLNLYLHQNYLDFFNNIDDVSVASNYLSDGDHLTAEWMHRSTLCCYTPSVAIRGLMFCNQRKATNQAKNVWRPLHKPKWWDVLKQTRHNMSTATDLFKGHSRNAGQFHCEYLPYLALTDVPLHSPGQINHLQTVCTFSKNLYSFRDNDGALQDKEIDDNDSEPSSSQPQSSQDGSLGDNEVLSVTETKLDDDIQEFESD